MNKARIFKNRPDQLWYVVGPWPFHLSPGFFTFEDVRQYWLGRLAR